VVNPGSSKITHEPLSSSFTLVSPSVAVYVLLQLLKMKMTQTSYQIDLDTWVRDVEAKRKEAASRPPSPSVVFRIAPKKSSKEQALAREIASNSGRTVRPIQTLLTTIGL
jgi:hypothetical protein